jgi:DNA-binding IclR family transcriptional regulator
LSTARAVLQVEWLLAVRPEGVRADQVADALGKSVSTAYNLLASLCDEGVAAHHPGGVYRLAPGFRDTVVTGTARAAELHDLSGLVADLLARTHKRSYLAVLRGGTLEVVHERGLQGMPKRPGLAPRVRDTAHALALGKVVLALGRPELVDRYVDTPACAGSPPTRSPIPRRSARSSRPCAGAASRSSARSSIPTSAASPRRCTTRAGASSPCSASR